MCERKYTKVKLSTDKLYNDAKKLRNANKKSSFIFQTGKN